MQCSSSFNSMAVLVSTVALAAEVELLAREALEVKPESGELLQAADARKGGLLLIREFCNETKLCLKIHQMNPLYD